MEKIFPEAEKQAMEFEESIYIVKRSPEGTFHLSSQPKTKIVCSILLCKGTFFLFKDNGDSWSSKIKIRIDGKPIYSFTTLALKNLTISVENGHEKAQFKLWFNPENFLPATSATCAYCWEPFQPGERVIWIERDEFHAECAREYKMSG